MEVSYASDNYKKCLEISNYVFVVLFLIEAVLKLIGLGPSFYFKNTQNQFDFAIVILSMFGLQEKLFAVNFTSFRIVRVARLLRMLKTSRELQMLLKTLYLAVANILNVCLLFLLVIFTFTIAGMDLFGDIEEGKEKFIHSECNFRTFYSGMMLLIRTSTGESWNGIMHDTAALRPWLARIYWINFTFCGFFIYVNVLIAVIFEEYCNANYKPDDLDIFKLTLK
jgi:hypothetical protein